MSTDITNRPIKFGNKFLQEEISKFPKMTKEYLLKHCRENRLYSTPELNDVLYLHFKGFGEIQNLEAYTGLKCLWLENNGLLKISGLTKQDKLRCLFLHHNLIRKIENLENCPLLDTINLSYNQLYRIENIDCLPVLNTLNLAHNYISELENLEALRTSSVGILDLSFNRISDPLIVGLLGEMKYLRVLSLMGNPVIRNIPAYRKTLTLSCKQLTYLGNSCINIHTYIFVEANRLISRSVTSLTFLLNGAVQLAA